MFMPSEAPAPDRLRPDQAQLPDLPLGSPWVRARRPPVSGPQGLPEVRGPFTYACSWPSPDGRSASTQRLPVR